MGIISLTHPLWATEWVEDEDDAEVVVVEEEEEAVEEWVVRVSVCTSN